MLINFFTKFYKKKFIENITPNETAKENKLNIELEEKYNALFSAFEILNKEIKICKYENEV